ncbi:MAG TPA: bacteriohemerythrin [Azospira sp.]|nr:bacteriohemerythrin [Azospira sp.]HNN08451.1 bacteriohemerythrin [Azospira sp.]HNN46514.1 bacteriohemerythrin [Azospira sp.]
MSLITWNDYFVTGIDIIDEQHRWLIGLINEAAPVLVQPYAVSHETADRLLDQLTEYAVFHFQTEARLMADNGIDKRHSDHHLASHADFAAHVGEMRERYERTGDISGGELLTFLANWLVFHILSDDQVLGSQLVAIRKGTAPGEAFERAEGKESDPALQAKTQALIDLYQLINLQYSNLQAVYQELDEHKNHLEEMVAQRTGQLAQARDLAEAASRAKSAFLANMSHEFRTPMNAIAGMSWSLQQEVRDPAQREKLQIIARASQRLQEMLAEVLDVVKLESEQLNLEPIDFSLATLLAHASKEAAASAESKALGFSAEIPQGLPDMLHGDARRIGQMLGHLLSNAIKFTDHGHVVLRVSAITGEDPPLQFAFSVADTGPGIPADKLPRLFQLFEQADSSTKRSHGGAGLGLALCKRLARLMGGDITVASTPGEGSVFRLTIPLQAAHAQHAPAASAPDDTRHGSDHQDIDWDEVASTLNRLRPLVAEDDIRALSLWSETAGRVTEALGAQAAQIGHELDTYNFEGALALIDSAIAALPARTR